MNTIQPQIQQKYKNNNISFKALKGFEYCGSFNPHINITDAKTVLALKKSETFKDFFKKYDCVARFGFWDTYRNQKTEIYTNLKIFYKEKEVYEPEQNWLSSIYSVIAISPCSLTPGLTFSNMWFDICIID